MAKTEEVIIEELAEEAERNLKPQYDKKDQKEKRSLLKQTLYDGSRKLKHAAPKGVRS